RAEPLQHSLGARHLGLGSFGGQMDPGDQQPVCIAQQDGPASGATVLLGQHPFIVVLGAPEFVPVQQLICPKNLALWHGSQMWCDWIELAVIVKITLDELVGMPGVDQPETSATGLVMRVEMDIGTVQVLVHPLHEALPVLDVGYAFVGKPDQLIDLVLRSRHAPSCCNVLHLPSSTGERIHSANALNPNNSAVLPVPK